MIKTTWNIIKNETGKALSSGLIYLKMAIQKFTQIKQLRLLINIS
jgi:hypothetical protein